MQVRKIGTHEYLEMTVAELGFKEGATSQKIMDRARELGLEILVSGNVSHIRGTVHSYRGNVSQIRGRAIQYTDARERP